MSAPMAKVFRSIRDRLSPTEGYSLAEMLIVLLVFSVVGSLFAHRVSFDTSLAEFYLFKSELAWLQSECMAYEKSEALDLGKYEAIAQYEIRFNELGHINMAQTIRFKRREGVIELASGVFVEK